MVLPYAGVLVGETEVDTLVDLECEGLIVTDGVAVLVEVTVRVTESVGVTEAVRDKLGVTEGVAVLVILAVTLAVEEIELVTD